MNDENRTPTTTYSLTPPERETMVNGCDADDHITVWSAQRKIITKLRKHPDAQLLEEGYHGTTVWAKFKLPARCLSFRSVRPPRQLTEEQRAAAAERLRKLHKSATP